MASVLTSVSHPSELLLLQFAKPVSHAPITHMPSRQPAENARLN